MGTGEREIATRWEWVVAGVSAALLIAALSFLVYDGVVGAARPPFVTVAVESVHDTLGLYLVQFRAHNHGDRAAADVRVVGELHRGGRSLERGEVVFEFIPPRGSRTGGLLLRHDPRTLPLTLGASGYVSP